MPAGRPRVYADNADRQRAYRLRSDVRLLVSKLATAIGRARAAGVVVQLYPAMILDDGFGSVEVLTHLIAEVQRQTKEVLDREVGGCEFICNL